ncbi:MAG: glycoside hydrolase, partial [Bacteroidales bacterium]|nr:glycoside hydrolase [Bacteroidales bacterium]
KSYPIATPAESDEFTTPTLGLQWQWHANPQDWWAYNNTAESCLQLYTVPVPSDYRNLYDVPNLLLQKWPAPEFTVTCKLEFRPNTEIQGERVGLVVMGLDYAQLSLTSDKDDWSLAQGTCLAADKGNAEVINESVSVKSNTPLYLRVKVVKGGVCDFSYSLDNEKFLPIGASFTAKEGKWIGAKVGLFATRSIANNDGGCAKVEWFRIINNE